MLAKSWMVPIRSLAIALAMTAIAHSQSIVYDPNPLVMGDIMNCRYVPPSGGGVAPTSWEWYCRWTGVNAVGDCYSAWVPNPSTTGAASYTFGTPGFFELKMVCKYPPPMAPVEVVIPLVVAKPDSWAITKGLDTPTSKFSACEVNFTLKAGSRTIGSMPVALAQEKITIAWTPIPGFTLVPPNVWTPNAPDPNFTLQGPWIVDKKAGGGAIFDAAAIGQAYYYIHQQLRLVYNNPCGGTETINLPEAKLKRVRHSAFEWKIQTY